MDAHQNRKEYKFILPPGKGERMREEVGKHLVVDRDFDQGYPVLSEYFDTDERSRLLAKAVRGFEPS